MRVPEAAAALDSLRRVSLDEAAWNKEATRILDAVWLTAYEEGKNRLFEPPYNGRGRHEKPQDYLPNQ